MFEARLYRSFLSAVVKMFLCFLVFFHRIANRPISIEVVERAKILPKNFRTMDFENRQCCLKHICWWRTMQIDLVRIQLVRWEKNAKYIQRCQSAAFCEPLDMDMESKELPRISNQQKNNPALFALVVSIQGGITSVYSGYNLLVQGLKNKE